MKLHVHDPQLARAMSGIATVKTDPALDIRSAYLQSLGIQPSSSDFHPPTQEPSSGTVGVTRGGGGGVGGGAYDRSSDSGDKLSIDADNDDDDDDDDYGTYDSHRLRGINPDTPILGTLNSNNSVLSSGIEPTLTKEKLEMLTKGKSVMAAMQEAEAAAEDEAERLKMVATGPVVVEIMASPPDQQFFVG